MSKKKVVSFFSGKINRGNTAELTDRGDTLSFAAPGDTYPSDPYLGHTYSLTLVQSALSKNENYSHFYVPYLLTSLTCCIGCDL